jgi:hypothetical protein
MSSITYTMIIVEEEEVAVVVSIDLYDRLY